MILKKTDYSRDVFIALYFLSVFPLFCTFFQHLISNGQICKYFHEFPFMDANNNGNPL